MKRVLPAEAGEAAEVIVVGVEFGVVLNGESGDVSVSSEPTADTCGLKNPPEEREVPCGGDQFCDVGIIEPAFHKA